MIRFLAYLFSIYPRLQLYSNIRRQIQAVKNSLLIFKKGSQRAKKNGISASGQLNSIAMYISILWMDLTVLRSRLVLEQDEYVKNVYARQLAILIYEFIKNYSSVFGKQFRKTIDNLPNGKVHIKAFNAIGKEINNIRKRHSNMLKEIRNFIAAHMLRYQVFVFVRF